MICVIHDSKESKNVTFQFYRLEKKKTLSYDVLEQILFSLMVL